MKSAAVVTLCWKGMYDAEKGGGRKEKGTGRSIHDW
jgi:hypothetical protein